MSAEPLYCPECVQGKHHNCTGQAWDHENDDLATCECREGWCGERG